MWQKESKSRANTPPCWFGSMSSCLSSLSGPHSSLTDWCSGICLWCSKKYNNPLHFLLCQFNWSCPLFSYSKDLEFEHIQGLIELFAMWIMSITILLKVCLKAFFMLKESINFLYLNPINVLMQPIPLYQPSYNFLFSTPNNQNHSSCPIHDIDRTWIFFSKIFPRQWSFYSSNVSEVEAICTRSCNKHCTSSSKLYKPFSHKLQTRFLWNFAKIFLPLHCFSSQLEIPTSQILRKR